MARERRIVRSFRPALAAALLAACAIVDSPGAQRPAFDVLITNGRIVDRTGARWLCAGVGITGGPIAAIGALAGARAAKTIDASNLVVSPGFIDLLGQSEF